MAWKLFKSKKPKEEPVDKDASFIWNEFIVDGLIYSTFESELIDVFEYYDSNYSYSTIKDWVFKTKNGRYCRVSKLVPFSGSRSYSYVFYPIENIVEYLQQHQRVSTLVEKFSSEVKYA